MIDTLTIRNCPEEVTSEILIIIDDLIYKDDDFSSKHSVTFVIEYDLLRVLWSLVNAHRKYVLNIFSNLALRE